MIVLATDPAGERAVLGRQPHWPEGTFSCLAGFVEAGESAAQVKDSMKGSPWAADRRIKEARATDAATLRRALEPGDVALVLTEPAMTNTVHLLLPD